MSVSNALSLSLIAPEFSGVLRQWIQRLQRVQADQGAGVNGYAAAIEEGMGLLERLGAALHTSGAEVLARHVEHFHTVLMDERSRRMVFADAQRAARLVQGLSSLDDYVQSFACSTQAPVSSLTLFADHAWLCQLRGEVAHPGAMLERSWVERSLAHLCEAQAQQLLHRQLLHGIVSWSSADSSQTVERSVLALLRSAQPQERMHAACTLIAVCVQRFEVVSDPQTRTVLYLSAMALMAVALEWLALDTYLKHLFLTLARELSTPPSVTQVLFSAHQEAILFAFVMWHNETARVEGVAAHSRAQVKEAWAATDLVATLAHWESEREVHYSKPSTQATSALSAHYAKALQVVQQLGQQWQAVCADGQGADILAPEAEQRRMAMLMCIGELALTLETLHPGVRSYCAALNNLATNQTLLARDDVQVEVAVSLRCLAALCEQPLEFAGNGGDEGNRLQQLTHRLQALGREQRPTDTPLWMRALERDRQLREGTTQMEHLLAEDVQEIEELLSVVFNRTLSPEAHDSLERAVALLERMCAAGATIRQNAFVDAAQGALEQMHALQRLPPEQWEAHTEHTAGCIAALSLVLKARFQAAPALKSWPDPEVVPALEEALSPDDMAEEAPVSLAASSVPQKAPSSARVEEAAQADRVEAQPPPVHASIQDYPSDWLDLHTLMPEPATRRVGDIEISHALYNAFLSEADEWSRQLVMTLGEWGCMPQEAIPAEAQDWAHALAGSAATIGHVGLARLSKLIEQLIEQVRLNSAAVQPMVPTLAAVLNEGALELQALLHQFAAGFVKMPSQELFARLEEAQSALQEQAHPPLQHSTSEETPLTSREKEALVQPAEPGDASSALEAVFAEEKAYLMPQLGAAIRHWAEAPQHRQPLGEALRILHTLKGSARLVGNMQVSARAHEMETMLEQMQQQPAMQEQEFANVVHDVWQLFEQLDSASSPAPLPVQVPQVQAVMAEDATQQPTPDQSEEGRGQTLQSSSGETMVVGQPDSAAPTPLPPLETSTHIAPDAPPVPGSVTAPVVPAQPMGTIRVRSSLLEQLLDHTGELMSERSRLHSQQKRSRQNLTALERQMQRMREHLQELSLQMETQFHSRGGAPTADSTTSPESARFDVLEMDRYTRAQELIRFLSEAASDVAALQRSLMEELYASEDSLAAQARQIKEVQRTLLRTRLVAFDSVAERLHKVVRQTGLAVGTEARLSIAGAQVEIDRSVLESITPVLEHLLRNAMVHGIEPEGDRAARGKPNPGQIRIQVQQHSSNHIIIVVADDGRGIDTDALVRAAIARGLILPHTMLSDGQKDELLFVSGLSTASEVTQIAGRGIGMDVVRSQIQNLGGQIAVHSTAHSGTSFELTLPLHTVLSQVVLVRTGTTLLAIPSALVLGVLRGKADMVVQSLRSGHWLDESAEYQGVPIYRLGFLLGQHNLPEIATETTNVALLLLQGAGQRQLVQVEEVLENQEVLTKNLGPQLSSLPGLVGMSVLASGQTVLIYNPLGLAHAFAAQAQALQEHTAVAGAHKDEAGVAQATVLVVDDSITVRRVLQSQLSRQGCRVLLANDGVQALELLQEQRPALILSDVEMPRMDGFELLGRIRQSPSLSDIPVVMITSRTADKHRKHATALGATHYLGKPYSEEELVQVLRQYVFAQATL